MLKSVTDNLDALVEEENASSPEISAAPEAPAAPRQKPNAELSAKASVDGNELLNDNFLSVLEMAARGTAWFVSTFSPKEGILAGGERAYFGSGILSLSTGRDTYSLYRPDGGSTAMSWLQKNLFAIASKNPTGAITGIDIKPSKKDGKCSFTIDMFKATGGLKLQFYYPDHMTNLPEDSQGTDEKSTQLRNARIRREVHEALTNLLSTAMPDKGKFPWKEGQKATFNIDGKIMGSEAPSKEPLLDEVSSQPIEKSRVWKSLEHMVGLAYSFTITNTTPEDKAERFSSFRIDVSVKVSVPIDFMYHITHSNEKTFKKALAYMYFGEAVKAVFTSLAPVVRRSRNAPKDDDAKVVWPVAVGDPNSLVKLLQDATAAYPRASKPRVDAKGWAVAPDGTFQLFPKNEMGNALVQYVNSIDGVLNRLETEKEQEKIDEVLKEAGLLKNKIAGRVLVTDWVHDVIMYATLNGEIKRESLNGYAASDPIAELRILNMRVSHPRIFTHVTNMLRVLGNANAKFMDEAHDTFEQTNPNRGMTTEERTALQAKHPDYGAIGRAAADLVAVASKGGPEVTVKHLAGCDLVDFENYPEKETVFARLRVIKAACAAAFERLDETFPSSVADSSRYGMQRWLIEKIATLKQDQLTAFNQIHNAEKAKFTEGALPPNFRIPNMAEGEALMPHQKEAISVARKRPRRAYRSIATGGGKTRVFIASTILAIEAGAKRILIFTKKDLVTQGISEVHEVTGGKMNAVALTPEILMQMVKNESIKSMADAVKWVKSFPPNTIFISEHNAVSEFDNKVRYVKIWENEPDSVLYVMGRKKVRQFAQFIAACDFDHVEIDEAHVVSLQNDSDISNSLLRILNRADSTVEMSGTVANNNASSVVGQVMMLDPMIFGSYEEAEEIYSLDKGDPTGESVKGMMREIQNRVAFTSKTREDWSYVLPSLTTDYVYPRLTGKQTKYYDDLLLEATAKVDAKALEDVKKNAGRKAETDDEKIETERDFALKAALSNLEQFLVAPDYQAAENAYPHQVGDAKPTGEDLISPHVAQVVKLIESHFASGNEGKVLVVGVNRAGSIHMMKHIGEFSSAIAETCLHYTAANKAVMNVFKKDDKYKVLIADAQSMQAGHNLQMVTLLIRIQTPWVPGDVEQTTARMYRPDFSGARLADSVKQVWSLLLRDDGRPTTDVIKAARVFSKEAWVIEARYADFSSIESQNRYRALETHLTKMGIERGLMPIKMTTEKIKDFSLDDAQPMFKARDAYTEFENTQARIKRIAMASLVESATGKSIIDHETGKLKGPDAVSTFLDHVMYKLPEGGLLPGSKAVWQPWTPRQKVADYESLDLALPQSDAEEASFKTSDNVWTSFGPGIVMDGAPKGHRALVKNSLSLWVRTGIGPQLIQKALLARPTTEEGKIKLASIIKAGITKYTLIPPGDKKPVTTLVGLPGEEEALPEGSPKGAAANKKAAEKARKDAAKAGKAEENFTSPGEVKSKTVNPGRKVSPEGPILTGKVRTQEDVDEEEANAVGLKVEAAVINGMPALLVRDPEVTFLTDIPGKEWHLVGAFASFNMTTTVALKKFVKAMTDEFDIDPELNDVLIDQVKRYTTKQRMWADRVPTSMRTRNFFREVSRPIASTKDMPNKLQPYMIAMGRDTRIVFLNKALKGGVKSKLAGMASKIPGAKMVSGNNHGFFVAFYPNLPALNEGVQKLETHATAAEVEINKVVLEQTLKDVKKLYSHMSKGIKHDVELQVKEEKKEKAKEKLHPEPKADDKKAGKGKKADDKDAKKGKKPAASTAIKPGKKPDKKVDKNDGKKPKAKSPGKAEVKKAVASKTKKPTAKAKTPAKKAPAKREAAKAPAKAAKKSSKK